MCLWLKDCMTITGKSAEPATNHSFPCPVSIENAHPQLIMPHPWDHDNDMSVELLAICLYIQFLVYSNHTKILKIKTSSVARHTPSTSDTQDKGKLLAVSNNGILS